MARVKIKFPDDLPLFITSIPVRIRDINYGGHMGNDSLLAILHEARLQFLVANGLSELGHTGQGMIMADVMIAYKGEAFHGDVLQVKVFAENITSHTFDLLYQVSTVRTEGEQHIAQAKTGMVCFDYNSRKVMEMEEKLKAVLQKA